MKEVGIYRKLAAMVLTLPWLVAAVVSAMSGGSATWIPTQPVVDGIVARVVNNTAATMAARRGVRLKRPLTVEVLDSAGMIAAHAGTDESASHASSDDEARTRPPVRWRKILLSHLGLLGPARGSSEGSSSASEIAPENDITGLYDLDHGRVLIANWADLASGRFAWTRDVAQALLDREFSLSRWLTAAPPSRTKGAPRFERPERVDDVSSDALLARQAVMLGAATVLALEALDPEGTLPSPRTVAGVAAQVRETIVDDKPFVVGKSWLELQQRLFVELEGLLFVAHLRARAPWRDVDEIWRRPATSSAQILHPTKYEQDQNPDDVARRLPAQPFGGWRVVYRDTLGEWGVRQFLGRRGDPYRAERASTGWGGDCALLLQSARNQRTVPHDSSEEPDVETESFVAWLTTWENDSDAADFAAQAARTLATLADTRLVDDRPVSGRLSFTDATGRVFALDHRRGVVGLLLGAPASTRDLLKRLTVTAVPTPGRLNRNPRGQGRGSVRPR